MAITGSGESPKLCIEQVRSDVLHFPFRRDGLFFPVLRRKRPQKLNQHPFELREKMRGEDRLQWLRRLTGESFRIYPDLRQNHISMRRPRSSLEGFSRMHVAMLRWTRSAVQQATHASRISSSAISDLGEAVASLITVEKSFASLSQTKSATLFLSVFHGLVLVEFKETQFCRYRIFPISTSLKTRNHRFFLHPSTPATQVMAAPCGAGVPPAAFQTRPSLGMMGPLLPGPHPRPVLQTRPAGIFHYIPPGAIKLCHIADQMVMVLTLPKFAIAPENMICGFRRIGFPGVEYICERCLPDRLE